MELSKYSKYGLAGRWVGWRNGLLASPRFQRFAARFALTRPVARRRSAALFDLVAGFTYSQILAACVETRLLELLAEGPLTASEIESAIDLPPDGAERLLRGAAALGLVERLGAAWVLAGDGAALLGNPGIAAMVAHHHLLYADLADPVALLRRGGGGGALSRHWHYAERAGEGDADSVGPYSALMAASQSLIAGQVIDAFPFERHRRLLDVGGGEGAFLAAVGAHVPELELGLFDLPAVGKRVPAESRITVHGGSFLTDDLPRGYDLVSLVRVLHDHDDDAALTLLRAIHAALPPGGTLIVAEPMAQTPGAERAGDAYFGFYLLAMGSGKPRSPAEIGALLTQAGFGAWRLVPTSLPLVVRVIAASR